jgi:hypothetical protein
MSTGTFVPPEFPPIDPETQVPGPAGPEILVVNRSFVPTGPTGPEPISIMATPFGGSGASEPIYIVSIDELLASHEVTIAKESADRSLLGSLITPSRETFRTALFQWAGLGFPSGHQIFSLEITPPFICSDGVVRNLNMYVVFLTESTIEQLVASIQQLMTGIQLIYSLSRTNTIVLSVSKA